MIYTTILAVGLFAYFYYKNTCLSDEISVLRQTVYEHKRQHRELKTDHENFKTKVGIRFEATKRRE